MSDMTTEQAAEVEREEVSIDFPSPRTIEQMADTVLIPRADLQALRDELAQERARREGAEKKRDEIQETLSMVESEVADAYCEITGGRFSKCNTRAVHIIDAVQEIYRKDMEDDLKPYIEQFDTLAASVRPLLATVKAWGEAMNDHDGGMPDDVLTAYKAAEKALGPVGEAAMTVVYDGKVNPPASEMSDFARALVGDVDALVETGEKNHG